MILLLSLAFWFAETASRWLAYLVLWPLLKFACGYLWCMLSGVAISALLKLRYEVYNRDLRLDKNQNRTRVLLITGAGSGIGLALARHFFRRGFVVVASYFTEDEPGHTELAQLSAASRDQDKRLFLVKLDVRSQESIDCCHSAVEQILEDKPALMLHAVVNVAGIGLFQKFQWTPKELIQSTVETNLTGPMLLTRQFLHLLVKTPNARVVNVASPLGLLASPYSAVYGPTKAALTQFSGALESDLRQHGVKTVTIQPGRLMQHTSIIDSSLFERMDKLAAKLTKEERALYKTELDDHQKLLDVVAKVHQRRKRFSEMRPLKKLAVLLDGAIVEDRLQDSVSFFRSFENSICLRDPPREMFAGNTFFTLVVGSLFQWLPRFILRDLILTYMSLVGLNFK